MRGRIGLLLLAICACGVAGFPEQDIIVPESPHGQNQASNTNQPLPKWRGEGEVKSLASATVKAAASTPRTNELVAEPVTSAFVSKLVSYCSTSAFGGNEEIETLCTEVATGAAQELLSLATRKLAEVAFTEFDCCSVTFTVGSVPIGKANFELTGTIRYTDGVLSISASSESQNSAINDYVSMGALNLGISANLEEKQITAAQIDGSVEVSLGFGDSTSGSVMISLEDGDFSLSAALVTSNIELAQGLKLQAGTVDLSYESDTIVMLVHADVEVSYNPKDSPLTVSVQGSYDSSTQEITLTGKMTQMLPKLFGSEILSAGMLKLSATLKKGLVQTAELGGVLCVGGTEHCQSGEATANNIISQLALTYQKPSTATAALVQLSSSAASAAAKGQWMFVAKVSQLDVRKIISAFGDSNLAAKLPDVLNLGLSPLQEECTDDSSLEDCFFLIAVTTVAQDLMDIEPPVRLKPGLTMLAKFNLPPSGDSTLLQLSLPIHGSRVVVPGSKVAAKFSLRISSLKDAEAWGPSNPIGQAKLPALLSLGQAKGITKLVYDMKFSAVLPLAVDAAKKGVPALKSLVLPGALSKSLIFFNKLMDKFPLQLEMNSDFTSSSNKYFAVTGTANNGGLGLTFIVNRQVAGTRTTDGIMAAVSLNTKYFGELIKLMIGSNPFDKVPSLSNLYVAGYASSTAFQLPTAVTLPSPFQNTRDIKAGFCFSGKLMKPTKSCGLDPVCALIKKSFSGSSSLMLKGCVNGPDTSLMIGVSGIKLSSSVTIREAGLTYESKVGPPPSVSFGASATLDVLINKEPITFLGKLYLMQKAASSVLGFSFATSGMFVRAFGIQRLNMYDLVLAAEVGVVAAVPVINSLTIGGGICFGPANKCKGLVSGKTSTALLQQAQSTSPQPEDYSQHLELLQRAQLTGAVAAKLYAGFDLDGNAFFYAGITKVTLADVASAFVDSNKLPSWLSKVGLEGYDQAACKAEGGAACFAYMSFASREKTITELSPPLTIPMGFNTQGRLTLFGASIGFQMQLIQTKLAMQLDASPLKLFGGKIQVYRLNEDYTISVAQTAANRTILHSSDALKTPTAEMVAVSGRRRRRRRPSQAAKPANRASTSSDRRRRTGSRRRAPVPYDSSKGPFFQFNADLQSRDFSMAFNGYAKIAGLGQAGIKVAVNPTTFEGTLVKVPVFSSPITMDVSCKISLNSPMGMELAAVLDITALASLAAPLLKATQAATKPIDTLKSEVEKASKAANKAFSKAKDDLDKAKKRVKKATDDCKKATANVAKKEKKCGGSDSRRRRARRRRALIQESTRERVKFLGKTGKAISKATKNAVASVCKAGLIAVRKTMNAACTTQKAAANTALRAAQKALSGIQKSMNSVLAAATQALNKVTEAIEALTMYQLNKVGFKASSLSPSVSLSAAIMNTKTEAIKTYTLALNLNKMSFSKLATAAFTKIFEPIKKLAVSQINTLKKKMSFHTEELVQMGAIEPETQLELVQIGMLPVAVLQPGEI